MRYTSTRGGSAAVDGAAAIIRRVPETGGLFVPESLPALPYNALCGLDFAERCEKVLHAFFGDIAVGVSEAIRRDFDEEQLPVVKLDDDMFAIELWHGKTCSACDLAKTVREFVLSRAGGINSDAVVDNSETSENGEAFECIAAQIAYWFSAYCDLADSGEIELGDKIYAAVPVAYSGNIIAAWYAQKMGLPIKKIVCADEENVLYDFVRSGKFKVREGSEDEDIKILCELERLVFSLSGDNAELTARMRGAESTGKFEISGFEAVKLRNAIGCEYMESEHIDEAIEYAFDEYGYLIDPVTAAAFAAVSRYAHVLPVVATAVAHPYTAAERVLSALGEDAKGTYKDMLDLLEDISAIEIPEALKSKD